MKVLKTLAISVYKSIPSLSLFLCDPIRPEHFYVGQFMNNLQDIKLAVNGLEILKHSYMHGLAKSVLFKKETTTME